MFRFIRDDEHLGWTGFDAYFEYLASIQDRLDPALYAFVSDPERYYPSPKKTLHDAWLQRLLLAPDEPRSRSPRMILALEFLGPYHDRTLRLRYDDVRAYSFDQTLRTRANRQDLLMHEFRIDESTGLLEHVFEFDDELYLRVACRSVTFEELMLDDGAQGDE